MAEKIKRLLNVKDGVTRIPAQSERSFFFYLTLLAVAVYLAKNFLLG